MEKGKEFKRDNVTDEQRDWKELSNICMIICENYEKLKAEFEQINRILKSAEVCGTAYRERSMIGMHIRSTEPKSSPEILKLIIDNLESVKQGAGLEFVQYIDLLNIYDVILEKDTKENIVEFVWQVKKIVQDIIYQLSRIKNENNNCKKVAILKGMIAYY